MLLFQWVILGFALALAFDFLWRGAGRPTIELTGDFVDQYGVSSAAMAYAFTGPVVLLDDLYSSLTGEGVDILPAAIFSIVSTFWAMVLGMTVQQAFVMIAA